MENTTTAAAWIITRDAVALGDPSIVITTRPVQDEHDEEGHGTSTVLGGLELAAPATLQGARLRLATEGWRVVSDEEELEAGHYLVSIEKI